MRCCVKTFLRSHTTYQQAAQLIWQSSRHIKRSGPPLTFHCTGSAYVQWRIGGSGHKNFSPPTTSLTSVEPPSTDLAAPRQTLWLGAMSPLHCTVRMCSEGGDGISTRHHHFSVIPLRNIAPHAWYSSRYQQKRYDNTCVLVTVNAEFKSESILWWNIKTLKFVNLIFETY